jgi:inorganic pyrophosphatase
MQMVDGGEADDKIIAVAANDMSVNHINDISELPPHFIDEMRHFFEEYKRLEKKSVIVEEFQNKEKAEQIIHQSFEDYRKIFKQS